MRKIIIPVILVIALTLAGGSALAVQVEPLQQRSYDVVELADNEPNLVLITSIVPVLNVSGTNANYSLSVTCVGSVNSIVATLQIQRRIGNTWSNYGSPWITTSSSSFLSTNGTRPVTSGGTYRLRVTVRASNGTTVGTATAYS